MQTAIYQNPYAFLDDSDDVQESVSIHQERMMLQNPYALLDGDGTYKHNLVISNKQHSDIPSLSFEKIEEMVRDLQNEMWRKRNTLAFLNTPRKPIEILDPVIALKFKGYQVEKRFSLGQFFSNGKYLEVAGLIDSDSKQVDISEQFSQEVMRFTTAHELGHAVLHNNLEILHRDRALDGSNVSRGRIEIEADKFASYFLMPKILVEEAFKDIYGTDHFRLDERTSFALDPRIDLQNKLKSERELSRKLASSTYYNGEHIISLAERFRVSIEAMAIRLEELKLLTW